MTKIIQLNGTLSYFPAILMTPLRIHWIMNQGLGLPGSIFEQGFHRGNPNLCWWKISMNQVSSPLLHPKLAKISHQLGHMCMYIYIYTYDICVYYILYIYNYIYGSFAKVGLSRSWSFGCSGVSWNGLCWVVTIQPDSPFGIQSS